MSDRKYDAFISYRHLPLDKAVAKRLQHLLETIRPPRGLECKNTKRISRIFRDESELPTSGDLGQDIVDALENSDFLIVLCSPKLKFSKWCMQEIEHFKQMHGGRINRILAVLVDGDHMESFPDALRYDTRIYTDENGVEQRELVEVEPLACNISSEGDVKKTLKKLNVEFLRIAAPILGCSFDDLYRRHRRRRIRRIIATSVSAFSLLLVASIGLTLSNRNVISHRDAMYVELSNAAYISGRIPDATEYALSALVPRNRLMPAFLPSARLALSTALGVYDFSEGLRPFEAVDLPARVFNITISDDGRTAAALYAFEVHVFDTATGNTIASLSTAQSAMVEAVFLDNDNLLFAGENGLSSFNLSTGSITWTSEPATAIAISADRNTIASINGSESRAVIHNTDGTIKDVVLFDGRSQRVVYHDIMGNPNRNLLALNHDGSRLAVSFDEDDLTVFDLNNPDAAVSIPGTHESTGFTGGFYGRYFAFSEDVPGVSVATMIIDMDNLELVDMQEFASDEFIVRTNEHGIFISHRNTIMQFDPASSSHLPVAFTDDAYITDFAVGDDYVVVSTDDNSIIIFNRSAIRLGRYTLQHLSDFVAIGGDHAITASRNTTEVHILQRRNLETEPIFSYDIEEATEQTRINADRTRVLRFSFRNFRLYDFDGNLINEVEVPDPMRVYSQRFSPRSGNIAMVYTDALRIFSGYDGALLFEETGLSSVFFADYGVSVFDGSRLRLIDLDSALPVYDLPAQGSFAAYAGMVVDSDFLQGGELIGMTRHGDGFLFAISHGSTGAVYDHNGRRRFEFATGVVGAAHFTDMAFFTDDAVVITSMIGVPAVYCLRSGQRIRELDYDAHLAYARQMGDYIVVEFVTAYGERFGILMDGDFQSLARLPWLVDIDVARGSLLFDHRLGAIRESSVFSLDELKQMAQSAQWRRLKCSH